MDVHESPPDHAGKRHYFYTVDGKRFDRSDEVQDARKLLQKAGLTPADDYVLIELLRPGTRTIGLDEDVDLDDKEREFRSFLTDRVFNFTVDEIGYEWGSAAISESQLRDIADVPAGKVLFLDRRDQEDLVLEEGSSVDLAAPGTEHFRTAKRLVTVFYKDKSFELKPGKYTGAQLAAIFGVPSQYQLDLVKQNGEFEEIKPSKSVEIKDGMHFVSHPPCGQSS